MKIYTKTGDDGTTSLFGGNRLYKNNNRVDAYGNVDELNSCIGFTADQLEDSNTKDFLRNIQQVLFVVGSHLATVDEKYIKTLPNISEADILLLENKIDEYHERLPKMTHFILPGGHPAISACHIARTVCRRAERSLVGVSHQEPIEPILIKYLNRLSDYLFVLARKIAFDKNIPEILWMGK